MPKAIRCHGPLLRENRYASVRTPTPLPTTASTGVCRARLGARRAFGRASLCTGQTYEPCFWSECKPLAALTSCCQRLGHGEDQLLAAARADKCKLALHLQVALVHGGQPFMSKRVQGTKPTKRMAQAPHLAQIHASLRGRCLGFHALETVPQTATEVEHPPQASHAWVEPARTRQMAQATSSGSPASSALQTQREMREVAEGKRMEGLPYGARRGVAGGGGCCATAAAVTAVGSSSSSSRRTAAV